MKKSLKIGIVVLLILALAACTPVVDVETETLLENALEVHYIDVGQGDAILIKTPIGENILIDAGKNSGADELIEYLKEQGVQSFSAVIGTHPHEDHIGGLDRVIDEFEVKSIYMPKIIHTTKTFEDVLDAIERKELKIKTASKGIRIPLNDADALFLAPISEEYEDLNNYSAVLRFQYGDKVFLFTGDAEALVEEEILANHSLDLLKAQVLKVGHHGSVTSTSESFLKTVSPAYGIISSKEGNSYGHPHDETLELLKNNDVHILRTDIEGTIIIKSDGQNLEILEGVD